MVEPDFWIRFALAVLATWRLTHLLAAEDGPADLIVRLRTALGQRFVGRLMDCFQCLSLWIAAPAALFVARSIVGWGFVWLGLSGAACLLERLGQSPVEIQPISASTEGDEADVLRSEAFGPAGPRGSDASGGGGQASGPEAGERAARR